MKTYTKKTTSQEPRLVIMTDENPESPREWSNLGYFITKDSRYNSPDDNEDLQRIISTTGEEAESQAEHMKMMKTEIEATMDEKVLIIYPIVKYEHGGVSYSLGTNHNFDYSNNGFYIVTDKSVKETGAMRRDFEKIIKGELEVYNKYANGEIYGFTLYDTKGELIDSCFGFYDMEDIRERLPKEWQKVVLDEYYQAS